MRGLELRFVRPELRAVMAGGDERPRVDARAIVYGSLSEDLGGWREVIAPNAIELEADLRILFDHQTCWVIGRTSAGTAEAEDDGAGVVFRAYPPETQWAADMLASMERGDIDQCSFRMLVLEDEIAYVESAEDPEGGYIVRTILKARVSELSVVAMPAYAATSAAARELEAVGEEIRSRAESDPDLRARLEARSQGDESAPGAGAAPEASGSEGGAGSAPSYRESYLPRIGFLRTKEG